MLFLSALNFWEGFLYPARRVKSSMTEFMIIMDPTRQKISKEAL